MPCRPGRSQKGQGGLIRQLDDTVLSLGDTAEALDALVSVAFRLRNTGVRYAVSRLRDREKKKLRQ